MKRRDSARNEAKRISGAAQPRPKRSSGAPKQASPRQVFSFGNGQAQGRGDMQEMLGGKGANLAEMTRLGVPVPPGFTISTGVCAAFNAAGGKLSEGLKRDVLAALDKVARGVEKQFGDPANPLLVSNCFAPTACLV